MIRSLEWLCPRQLGRCAQEPLQAHVLAASSTEEGTTIELMIHLRLEAERVNDRRHHIEKRGISIVDPTGVGISHAPTDGRVIVGVDVTTIGSDQGQLIPMLDQVEDRLDALPASLLLDGGFTKLAASDEAESRGGGQRCRAFETSVHGHRRVEGAGRRPRE